MKTIGKMYRFIDLVWNSMIAKILSWLPCLFLWSFLIDFLFKSDQNPILAALPPPVVVSCGLFIQKLSKSSPGCLASSGDRFLLTSYSKVIKILSWLPCFLLWSFCIDFLFKAYQHPLLAALVFMKIL